MIRDILIMAVLITGLIIANISLLYIGTRKDKGSNE